MGLFKKEFCAVCGEKISLLGKRKVEDGVVCSKCTKKLSPFFKERKKSTVNDIKDQLAYREDNRQKLNSFNQTRTYGTRTKVYIDDAQQCFVVSRARDFREDNADIIKLSQVTGARYDVKEHRSEIFRKDSEGRSVSYNPPRYEYSYEFKVYINVNSPYFDEIEFELTDYRPDSRYSSDYHRFEDMANELVSALKDSKRNMMNSNSGFMGMAAAAPFEGQQMMNGPELKNNLEVKFGSKNPVPYPQNINGNQVSLAVRFIGKFVISVVNPQQFMSCGSVEDISGALRAQVENSAGEAISLCARNGIPVAQLPARSNEIAKYVKDNLESGWQAQFGVTMESIAFASLSLTEESAAAYKQMRVAQFNRLAQHDYMEQQAERQYQQDAVQQQAQTWVCPACGTENTSKFCVGCGTPRG